MALNGIIDGQTLTTFVFYVEFVTAASLSVCDQWGSIMEVGNCVLCCPASPAQELLACCLQTCICLQAGASG